MEKEPEILAKVYSAARLPRAAATKHDAATARKHRREPGGLSKTHRNTSR